MEISREFNNVAGNYALINFLGEVRALTPNALGVLTRGNYVAFLADDGISAEGQVAVQNALNAVNSLTVSKNKAAILADGVDTVTFSHITAEASVKWFCYLDGDLYASGTEAASGGVVTLTLTATVEGIYALHILNLNGVGSGFNQVIAEN
jgi:hypothetical protein